MVIDIEVYQRVFLALDIEELAKFTWAHSAFERVPGNNHGYEVSEECEVDHK